MHYYLEVILAIVLVQPRKNRPYITERLLLGRKESNKQTNKNYLEACQMHAMYVFVWLNLQPCRQTHFQQRCGPALSMSGERDYLHK